MSWDEWDEYSYLTLTELLTMVYTPWCEFIVRFLNPYVMNRMCTYVKYSMQVGDGSVNSLCSKNIQLKRWVLSKCLVASPEAKGMNNLSGMRLQM